MNMLLAEVGPAQWILLGVIVLLIVCYPIFIVLKNKKEQQKAQQMTDSLKVGKEVLTSSGVYGTIVAIEEKENCKIVTLQTGTEENFHNLIKSTKGKSIGTLYLTVKG